MSVTASTAAIGKPPRVVRLTLLARAVRYTSVALMLGTPAMLLAMSWVVIRHTGDMKSGRLLFILLPIMFINGAFMVAAAEWMIRRERRLAQHGELADVVMVEDATGRRCYGLTDQDGRPFPFSPPIADLAPETLAAGERMTVLYNPRKCTRIIDIQKLRWVRFDG